MRIKERISRINLPARASMAYLGVSFIGKLVGIGATPFFTRLISQDEYGKLILYLTILGGASVICSAVSSGSAIYRCFRIYSNNAGGFLKSSLLASLGFSLLICILLFAFLPFSTLDRSLYLPLCLQIICDSIIGVALSKARYNYKYGHVVTVNLISSVLPVIFSLTVMGRYGCGCGARVYSMLILSILIAAAELMYIFRLQGLPNAKMTIRLLKTSAPLLPHSISSAFSGQADKLFITGILGASALAKYSVAHSVGIALQFAITALGAALGPWLIRRLEASMEKSTAKIISTGFILFCSASLGLSIIAPEALRILAPPDYSEALPAIIPIALSTPLSFISYTISVGLVHSEKGWYNALISILGLATCLALNYTLIPAFGYMGAGISILASQLVQVALGAVFLKKAGLSEMLNLKLLSLAFILTALACFIGYSIYADLPLRILFLILPAIAFLKALFSSKTIIKQ